MIASPAHSGAAAPAPLAAEATKAGRLIFSALGCLAIVAALMFSDDRFQHWFTLPVLICGVLVALDVEEWMRGAVDFYDPAGLIGIAGLYFFFFSPLLVIYYDHKLSYLPRQPDDYRNWLGGMALLNVVGLLVYRYVRQAAGKRPHRMTGHDSLSNHTLDLRIFWPLLAVMLAGSLGAQLYIYSSFGGIDGYVNAFMGLLSGKDAFRGTGWLTLIAESFPILVMMGFAVVARRFQVLRSGFVIALVLSLLLVLQIFFGGLRGSRSNTIWALAWAAGIVHFYVRRLPRWIVPVGLAVLFLFGYAFAFYKNVGADALDVLADSEAQQEFARKTGRNLEMLLVSDFGRADVQAFLLSKIWSEPDSQHYAWGQTYLGAACLLIPASVWPERPPGKVKWTTEAEFGPGSFLNGPIYSTRIYGLAGEAMLNFGLAGVPLAFAALGWGVAFSRRFAARLGPDDPLRMLAPFLINGCVLALLNDSDIQIVYFIKNGTIPLLLIAACYRWRRSSREQFSAPLVYGGSN
jgi:hypothetical protein